MSLKTSAESYEKQSLILGWVSILMTPVCTLVALLGGYGIIASISDGYATNARDILECVLAIAGTLLVSYDGGTKPHWITSTLMGGGAYGIALFPCCNGKVSVTRLPTSITKVFHGCFAAIFFVGMAYMSFFIFSKEDSKHKTIYRAGGVLLLLLCVLFALCEWVFNSISFDVLLVEGAALTVFGIIWLLHRHFTK